MIKIPSRLVWVGRGPRAHLVLTSIPLNSSASRYASLTLWMACCCSAVPWASSWISLAFFPALFPNAGRPKGVKEQDVYICDYRLDKSAHLFYKIHRNRYPVCTKPYAFDHFPKKLTPKRDFSVSISSLGFLPFCCKTGHTLGKPLAPCEWSLVNQKKLTHEHTQSRGKVV